MANHSDPIHSGLVLLPLLRGALTLVVIVVQVNEAPAVALLVVVGAPQPRLDVAAAITPLARMIDVTAITIDVTEIVLEVLTIETAR